MKNVGKHYYWFLVAILSSSCVQQPKPFQIGINAYTIRFPITFFELQKTYPYAEESLFSRLTDTTRNTKVVWMFENSTRDLNSQPYGVIISIRDKGNKIDSVRRALENRYNQVFQPLKRPKHMGPNEFFEPDSTLLVMTVNQDVQLSITKKNVWSKSGYLGVDYIEDIVISIGYNLDASERERFVLRRGEIRRDYD